MQTVLTLLHIDEVTPEIVEHLKGHLDFRHHKTQYIDGVLTDTLLFRPAKGEAITMGSWKDLTKYCAGLPIQRIPLILNEATEKGAVVQWYATRPGKWVFKHRRRFLGTFNLYWGTQKGLYVNHYMQDLLH